jgi:hypothetical protein
MSKITQEQHPLTGYTRSVFSRPKDFAIEFYPRFSISSLKFPLDQMLYTSFASIVNSQGLMEQLSYLGQSEVTKQQTVLCKLVVISIVFH